MSESAVKHQVDEPDGDLLEDALVASKAADTSDAEWAHTHIAVCEGERERVW